MAVGWLEEMKQRRVFRALVGYGIVSFAVLQVAEPVMHGLRLPDWVLGATVVALGLGFPITLVLAWVFDLRAGRIETTLPRPPRGRLLLLVALGVLLGTPGVAWYFWKQPRAAAPASAAPAGPPSIAVLAFADLSPGKDQEYFADGIAEEILDALARVKGLKVAGRTSSFHYKGKNEDLRTIGQTLGVANVLEGSVRKQGNRVRITAQLVQASDGFHRWSKSYDGELTDVFELQERIARDLTGELQVVLQGEQRARLVPVATRNPEAYALYLQATAIFNRRDGDRFHDAIAQVEQAIALDPGYARAHSRLATLQALLPAYVTGEAEAAQAAAEAHARRASALDPSLAEPHAVLGLVLSQRRRHLEALVALRQALALEPDDVTANFWYAATLTETGYLRRGTEVLDRVLAIDPILPNALMWRGQNALIDGDLELAERLMRRAQDLGLTYVGLGLSAVADARGQRAEAGRLLAAGLDRLTTDLPPGTAALLARGAFGDSAAREETLARVEAYLATRPRVVAGAAPYALLRLGRTARALEVIQAAPSANEAMVFNTVWGRYGRAARTSPQFPGFLRRVGLAELWDREGAPDACRRVGPLDYACE
jgi:TolB-like protein/tetratricopeptide (TPR) repeat protein